MPDNKSKLIPIFEWWEEEFISQILTFINPVRDSVNDCVCNFFTGTDWKNFPFLVLAYIWYVIYGIVFYKHNCWARRWRFIWTWKPWSILQSWCSKRGYIVVIYILSRNLPCSPRNKSFYRKITLDEHVSISKFNAFSY